MEVRTLDKIQCNDGLELIFKYSNSSPACVKFETIPKLIERGWGIPYLDKIMQFQETEYFVKYRIDGTATVTTSHYDNNTSSIIITIDTTTASNLTIELPRDLMDSGHSNCDPSYEREEPFFVLIDHEEVLSKEIITTSEKRIISIPFHENTRTMEIISICLI
jgi:hypothetical protein